VSINPAAISFIPPKKKISLMKAFSSFLKMACIYFSIPHCRNDPQKIRVHKSWASRYKQIYS
jgi:hypothetical protein